MTNPTKLRGDMAAHLHRWPGGAPNEAWAALEALSREMNRILACNHQGDETLARVVRERDENEGAFKVWRRRCEQAERERDEARAALKRYGWHDGLCRQAQRNGFDCTCGLDAALGGSK